MKFLKFTLAGFYLAYLFLGSQVFADKKYTAYYFYTNYRCSTCKKIEAYSKEAIEKSFSKEIKDGALTFKPLNMEENSNKHYIEDFKLYTKSLVIEEINNKKRTNWKNLEKVWTLTGNKDGFIKYVENEIKTFMTK